MLCANMKFDRCQVLVAVKIILSLECFFSTVFVVCNSQA